MTFEKNELEFLEKEFGYSEDALASMSEDELLEVGDKCFDIETEETIAAKDGDISERGEIAAGIVTKLNA